MITTEIKHMHYGFLSQDFDHEVRVSFNDVEIQTANFLQGCIYDTAKGFKEIIYMAEIQIVDNDIETAKQSVRKYLNKELKKIGSTEKATNKVDYFYGGNRCR